MLPPPLIFLSNPPRLMTTSDHELSPDELNDLLSSFMPEIPGYRVLRRIGRGGMSYVYLGVQESLDRQVAIKVMAPEALTDEISKQRFEQEARTIAKLEHPCIVGIHEVGRTEQGLLFYVLPYLAKGHLGQRDFSNDEPRAIEVLRALLSALEYAHARGIVHRDVKAENVLFDNADRPLLTDFGIALSKRDSTRITTTGLAVGSGGYMAPEQARGEHVDGRADLYSVGVLAFELMAGQLPFQNPDALGLALMHAQDPVPRLPADKRHWQPFIDRAMAKSADHRFRNAQQMFAALNEVEDAREKANRLAFDWRASLQPLVAHWKPLVTVTASVVIVVALLASWQQRRSQQAPDFFVAQDAAPTAAATVAEAVVPDVPPVIELSSDTTTATPPVAGATADTVYAGVVAEARLTPLDYDPAEPGARELSAARRQLGQAKLSLPAGDNAMESLLAAHALAPQTEALPPLTDHWLAAVRSALVNAITGGRDDVARALDQRAKQLATTLQRSDSTAWRQLREGLIAPLNTRLEAAHQRSDAAALDATKALASALEIPPASLEPLWSKALVRAKPGDAIEDVRVDLVLVRVAAPGRPGFAAMRQEVTRSEYAAFANATQRPPARCRNRTAPISLKRRLWNAPGFEQAGSHPVVCVSSSDAAAYAEWLGQRDGRRYRLPTGSEWRALADYRGTGDVCRNGHIDCGSVGTTAAKEGPASPLGLRGLQGNVREWLADCAAGCRRRLAAGLGWRDTPARAQPLGSNDFDADVGFDDIGFRLVQDIAP